MTEDAEHLRGNGGQQMDGLDIGNGSMESPADATHPVSPPLTDAEPGELTETTRSLMDRCDPPDDGSVVMKMTRPLTKEEARDGRDVDLGEGAFFLMPMESIPMMHRELNDALGEVRAREILFRYGYRCGDKVVSKLHPEKVGLKYLFKSISQLWSVIGLTTMRIKKVDWKGLTIAIEGSGEADGLGRKGKPSCHFTGGYLTGLASTLSGENFKFKEVECVSKGDPMCVFKLIDDIDGVE